MWQDMHARVRARTSKSAVAVLVTLTVACMAGFKWRERVLAVEVGLLDPRVTGYNAADVDRLLHSLGEQGRTLYGWTELTLDMLFPLTYVSLALLTLAKCATPRQAPILALPILTGATDVCENIAVAVLAFSYPPAGATLSSAAAMFTVLKWISGLGSAGFLAVRCLQFVLFRK